MSPRKSVLETNPERYVYSLKDTIEGSGTSASYILLDVTCKRRASCLHLSDWPQRDRRRHRQSESDRDYAGSNSR